MADDRFDGRPYPDTLTLASVLVMPGDPWPAAFYARYPEAFRLAVRVVGVRGRAATGAGTDEPWADRCLPERVGGG